MKEAHPVTGWASSYLNCVLVLPQRLDRVGDGFGVQAVVAHLLPEAGRALLVDADVVVLTGEARLQEFAAEA